MRPIKVLHVLHDSRRSGLAAMAAGIVRHLDRTRFAVEVYFATVGIYSQELSGAGIVTRTFSRRMPILWRFNSLLYNLPLPFIAMRFDVVHVHSIKNSLSVLAAKLSGARVVFHLHEIASRKSLLLQYAMRKADCVVFCGEFCAKHYDDITVRKKITISNAIAVADFACGEPNYKRLTLLMLSFYSKAKGQDLALQALAVLGRQKVNLHCYGSVGISNRSFYRQLQEFTKQMGLESQVVFHQPIDDPRPALRDATVLLLPSRKEAFGLVLLEAMASGLPVIAHDAYGMREIVEDGKTGYLIPLEDIEALADRIGRIVSNPELGVAMGQAGRQRACQHYDMASRIVEFEDLYRELAGGS